MEVVVEDHAQVDGNLHVDIPPEDTPCYLRDIRDDPHQELDAKDYKEKLQAAIYWQIYVQDDFIDLISIQKDAYLTERNAYHDE